MNKIKLTDNLKISPLVHGYWRLLNWKISTQELLKLTQELIELGFGRVEMDEIRKGCIKKRGELFHEYRPFLHIGGRIVKVPDDVDQVCF